MQKPKRFSISLLFQFLIAGFLFIFSNTSQALLCKKISFNPTLTAGSRFVRQANIDSHAKATGLFASAGPMESVYLGKFGDQHFALEGERIIHLSSQTIKNFNFQEGLSLPPLPKQPTNDSCLPTSLNYLFNVLKVNPAQSALPLNTNSLAKYGALANPFNPMAATAHIQLKLVRENLTTANLPFQETDSVAEVIAALQIGKKVLLGVIAEKDRTLIEIEDSHEHLRIPNLTPYKSGQLGHAMIGLAAIKDNFGKPVLVLADPYSGSLQVIPETQISEALQVAFILN